MKRIGLIVLLLLLPVLANGQAVFPRGMWTCSLADLAAVLTECQAAATSPDYYVITQLIVQTTTSTSGAYAVRTGTGVNCVTGTAGLFPSNASLTFKAPVVANPTAVINFNPPLAAPVGAAICVLGTGTNLINIQLIGYTNR
jgi:hypothetical protein